MNDLAPNSAANPADAQRATDSLSAPPLAQRGRARWRARLLNVHAVGVGALALGACYQALWRWAGMSGLSAVAGVLCGVAVLMGVMSIAAGVRRLRAARRAR